MNTQDLINRCEGPLMVQAAGMTAYADVQSMVEPATLVTRISGVIRDGHIQLSGITKESLLTDLLANSNGRAISSADLIRVVREVSRLCEEHDGPDVVGFDDLSASLDQALDAYDEAQQRLPVRENPYIDEAITERKSSDVSATEKQLVASIAALPDHLAGAN